MFSPTEMCDKRNVGDGIVPIHDFINNTLIDDNDNKIVYDR